MNHKVVQIPLKSDQLYTYKVNLEGKSRVFYFYLNRRTNIYHFDISEQDGTQILNGIPLLSMNVIGDKYSLQAFGLSGYFFLYPLSDKIDFQSVAPSDLGKYFIFVYIYEV